jgi:hypothetical protein
MALGKFIRVFYGQTQPWLQSSFVISVIVSTRGIVKDCLPAPAVKSSRNLEGTPSRHPISNRRCNPASGFEKPSTGKKQTKNCSNNDGGEGGIRTHGTVSRTLAFEASTFNRSVTSPRSGTLF